MPCHKLMTENLRGMPTVIAAKNTTYRKSQRRRFCYLFPTLCCLLDNVFRFGDCFVSPLDVIRLILFEQLLPVFALGL